MSLLYSRLILAVGALLVDVCHKQVVTAQNYQLTSSCGGSVQAGGSCTLMCYTGEASHTVIQWLNGTIAYRVSQGSCSSTSPFLPADYTTSCPSSTNFTLTINNAVYGRDRLSWSCDYQFGGRPSNQLSIRVLVSLSSVSITRTTTSISCVAVSNPPPSMTLYRDRTSVATSPAAAEGDTGWTATINYQLTGNSRNSLYYCQASNTQTTDNSTYSYPEIAVSSVSLTTITSANQEVGAAEGQPLTLTCVTTASYPAATVTWYKNSVEVTVGISSSSTVTSGVAVQTTSTVTFNSVGRSDLGHTVYCRATNIHTPSPVQSDSARMAVWYAPSKPSITVPPVLCEGRPASSLGCSSSDPGNPAASYTWTKNSLPVSPDFSPARTDNRATMTCSAGNIFTNRTGHTAPVSDTRQLNVHYSPQLSIQPTPSLTRKEGESLSLTCVSDSNPSTSDSDIKWVFGGVETQGPGLQKSNLSRYDDGVYTCRAAVNAGTCGTLQGHREVKVTVNYAPDVNMREADLTEGQTLSLLCHAEGRPSVYTFTRLTQYWGDTEIESRDGQEDGDNYTLTIDSATYLDAGMYECRVDNTVTDRNDVLVQRKRVSVNVRASPKFTHDSKQIFADEVGTNTTVVQSFYNSDLNNTSYNWTFGQLDTPINRPGSVRSSKVTLRKNNKEVQHAGFSVSLEIQNFQEQDIGVYTVTVCNVVGCNSTQVNLTAAGPPLVPLEFMVVNTTQTSVLLRWKSNFPGGSANTQVFVLHYREKGKSADWETREYVDNPGGYVYGDVTGLKSGTGYEFKVMARNNRPANNEGPFTQVESEKTENNPYPTDISGSSLGVGLGVGLGICIIIIIVLVAALLYLRRRFVLSTQDHGKSTAVIPERSISGESVGNTGDSQENQDLRQYARFEDCASQPYSQLKIYENTKGNVKLEPGYVGLQEMTPQTYETVALHTYQNLGKKATEPTYANAS